MRRIRRVTSFVLIALLAAACALPAAPTAAPTSLPTSTGAPTSTPTSVPTIPATATFTAVPAPTATPTEAVEPTATLAPEPTPTRKPIEYEGLPLPIERGALFSASGACTICHDRLTDSTGEDVSIGAHWRSTMMANAARDPYFQAGVRIEVLVNPELQAVIEDKCTRCHTPMAQVTALTGEGETRLLNDGFGNAGNELHVLGMDGVSCTLCHQIQPDGLGQIESYSGGYVVDTETPFGERLVFGPFPTDEQQAEMMRVASGFFAVESPHISESELCATCHTLYTPSVDGAGQIVGEFPEQTPYLEWLASDYVETLSCQDCHMPAAAGEAKVSATGGAAQSPFSKHIFVGGNVYMLNVLKRSGLGQPVTASSAQFDATIERTVDQLQNRTATVEIVELEVSSTTLAARVGVDSQVGHKFPTGFPARRAWLHVTVLDGDGQIVFESGAVRSGGAIVGNDNDESAKEYEPHYLEISDPDQVQIYEALMVDPEGNLTTVLLSGYGYAKDNRLLPQGFDAAMADADIAPYGAAVDDSDFDGGGDQVLYRVDLGSAKGPFTVEVELLYQSIGYRWAENVRSYQGAEIDRFDRSYQEVPNLPVIVASATETIAQDR